MTNTDSQLLMSKIEASEKQLSQEIHNLSKRIDLKISLLDIKTKYFRAEKELMRTNIAIVLLVAGAALPLFIKSLVG